MTGTGPVPVPAGFRVGRWVVGEPLGCGAWGSVYAARGVDDGEDAALKFLPSAALTPGHAAHLHDVVERELRFSSAGGHGLVRTIEILVATAPEPPLDGAHVLVMERAASSLLDVIVGGAPATATAPLLIGLWEAVAAVHAEGWIHGDVKPANVLVLEDGTVRLADFGLATEIDGTHAYAPHAASLDAVGPEWWSDRVGELGIRVRPARDLWSVGVACHLALSGGRYPFDGQTSQARALAARSYADGDAALRLAATIPAAWRPVIEALLEPDEQVRESRRDEVDALIRGMGGDAGVGSDPVAGGAVPAQDPTDASTRPDPDQRGPRARRPKRLLGRRRAVAGVGGVALVAAAAVAALAVRGGDPADGTPPRTTVGGELAADAPVPEPYRAMVVDAAHRCASDDISPALIAAMLRVESDFDPGLRDTAEDEVGIARWTPSVFRTWAVDVDGGGASPRSAADSIRALGGYLCAIRGRLGRTGSDPGLMAAAAYRVGSRQVVQNGAVPPEARGYVDAVRREATRYAATAEDGG